MEGESPGVSDLLGREQRVPKVYLPPPPQVHLPILSNSLPPCNRIASRHDLLKEFQPPGVGCFLWVADTRGQKDATLPSCLSGCPLTLR